MEKLYRGIIVALVLLLMALGLKSCKDYVSMSMQFHETKDSMQQKIDSLSSEIFVEQTKAMRYEITLDWFRDENPKAAEQFENFLYTQTE